MSYEKRYSEARLARWTAKQAIAQTLRLPTESLGSVEVRNAPDGAPEAFVDGNDADVEIAMTDRADWAVCMVAPGPARIGCDLELVEPRSRAFVADYLTGPEQQTVAQAPDQDLAANLIWSAKESALKVLRTGLRRDTRTVEVSLLPSGSDDWSGLEVKDLAGHVLPGWWIRYGEFVLTWCGEVPMAAPVSLVDPTPLAMAQPSHTWMKQPRRPPLR
jgi:4'-phosphopantetheinyl transferase